MTKKIISNLKEGKAHETVPVSSLRFFEGNPKKYTSKQFKRLLKSIKDIGIVEPLTVNPETMTVLNGNQRLKCALQLGFKEVPVIWRRYSKKEEGKILIHLNKTLSEQDDVAMSALISQYADDPFIQEMLSDYAASLDKSLKNLSPEYQIAREIDESYNYVVFIIKKSVDFLNVETFFNLAKVYDQHRQKLLSMGRVVDGKYLAKLIDLSVAQGIKNINDFDV